MPKLGRPQNNYLTPEEYWQRYIGIMNKLHKRNAEKWKQGLLISYHSNNYIGKLLSGEPLSSGFLYTLHRKGGEYKEVANRIRQTNSLYVKMVQVFLLQHVKKEATS